MQIPALSPVFFGARKKTAADVPQAQPPVTASPAPGSGAADAPKPEKKQRYLIMIKPEVLQAIAQKAAGELKQSLKDAGFKRPQVLAEGGWLKIMATSKQAAEKLKAVFTAGTIKNLTAVNTNGLWQFGTALPDAHKGLTNLGFPDPYGVRAQIIQKPRP